MAFRLGRIGPELLVAVILAVGAAPAMSQEAGDSSTAEPGSTLVPLPALFYQPETGLGFGAAVLYLFRLEANDSTRQALDVPPSTITTSAIFTTKKQLLTGIQAELYPAEGKFRITGRVGYLKFPTKFWGIGNDTPDGAEEDFTPRTFELFGEVQRQVARGWFVGGSAQYASRTLADLVAGGQLEAGQVPGATDGSIISLGVVVTRDTRNNIVFPRTGSFHQLRAAFTDATFPGARDFTSVVLDLRSYFSLFTNHVIAARALGQGTVGTAPFDLLPQLGGERLLRGYYTGRYRDDQLLALQVEYRAPLVWRLGVAGFVAAGRVAPSWGDMSFEDIHATAGTGLRISLSRQEGLNLRLDYGWGLDSRSSGFYLGVGESF